MSTPTFILEQSNGFPPAPAEVQEAADRMAQWLKGGVTGKNSNLGPFLRTLDSMREGHINVGLRKSARRQEMRLRLNTCPSCERAGCRSHGALVSWLGFKGWYCRQPRQPVLISNMDREAA